MNEKHTARQKLGDKVRGVSRVNLSYGSNLLHLSKQYFHEIGGALWDKPQPHKAADSAYPEATAPAPRPPLILSARSGEIANAAILLNNSSELDGTLNFEIIGDFPGIKVYMDPKSITLDPGESLIIRVMAEMNDEIPVGVNFPGVVVIVELKLKVAEFVLQRLPCRDARPRAGSKIKTKPASDKTTKIASKGPGKKSPATNGSPARNHSSR
ncbi:hypothetical protein A9Q89_02330 [Gammaproteobacteria bacterium 53_120_T64]|nr:hypothetical protein A9Q89_02330 [Gammaproteobacteria bacterium 53_120_T64]